MFYTDGLHYFIHSWQYLDTGASFDCLFLVYNEISTEIENKHLEIFEAV